MQAAPHIYLFFLFAMHCFAEIGQQFRKLNLVTDIGIEQICYEGIEAAVITGDLGVFGMRDVGVVSDGVRGGQVNQQEVVRASISRGSVEIVSFLVQGKDTIDSTESGFTVGVVGAILGFTFVGSELQDLCFCCFGHS